MMQIRTLFRAPLLASALVLAPSCRHHDVARPLGVGENVFRGGKLLVLAGSGCCLLDLVQLERQQIETGRFLALVHARSIARLAERLDRLPGRGDLAPQRSEPRRLVQHGEMGQRIEKRLVFVLSVKLDEPIGEVTKRGRRRQRIVDERPAPPLARDFAADDRLAFSCVLENRFDDGLLCSGSNQIG